MRLKVLFAKVLFGLFLMAVSLSLKAQVFLQNMKKVDGQRYEDYTGNPYYFEDNQKINLYVKEDKKAFEIEAANINLLTGSVEIYKGDEYAEIDKNSVVKIEAITNDANITITPDPKNRQAYDIKLYKSENYTLTQKISAKTDQRTYNTPGKTMVKEYIRKTEDYTLEADGKVHQIEIKKKDIINILGKETEKTLKKTKNKLKSSDDLVDLLKSLDNQ